MDYETRTAIRKAVEEYIKWRDCPKCHSHVPMVEVEHVDNPNTDAESYKTYYRCLGCLKLFKKELIEV